MLFVVNTQFELPINAEASSHRSFERACDYASELQNRRPNTTIELSVSYSYEESIPLNSVLFRPQIPITGRDQIKVFLDGRLLFQEFSFPRLFAAIKTCNEKLSHMHAANLCIGELGTRVSNLYFTKYEETPLAKPLVYREYAFKFSKPPETNVRINWPQEGF